MSDSSTDDAGVQADNTAGTSADNADVMAGTSPATEDVTQPESLLDAITKSVEPKSDADPSTAPPEVKDPARPDPAKAGKEAQEQPPPFAKHPAWQQQLAKRRAVDAQNTKLDAQVKELSPRADNWSKLEGYVQDAGITGKQFDTGLQVMRLWNAAPEKCREVLREQLAYLDNLLGETLSPELKTAVESGEITEEHARMLSRTNAKATRLEATVKDRETAERESVETGRRQHFKQSIVDTWNGQSKRWGERDPDFKAKSPDIEAQLALLMATKGHPRTVDQAGKLLEEAYQAVSQRWGSRRPPLGNVRELPVGGKSATPTPQHGSLMDAIDSVLTAH